MDRQEDESMVDFLQILETDVALYIMSFLNDPADVVRASAVSRLWHQFVISHGLAKELCLKAFPQLSNVGAIEIKSWTTNSTEVKTDAKKNWETQEGDQKVYAPLLQALTKSKISPKDCIANAVSASSTDNYPEESIVNTLNPRDRFNRRASYWSSKGHRDPEVPETLIYKLRTGIWVITEIDLQPFEAFFYPRKPIYSPKAVRFRIGHPKSLGDVDNDLQHLPMQNPADDKFVWTYTSPEFPVAQENRLQRLKLPEPVLCIGRYIQIELLGRVQREEIDGLFYICVCHIRVMGRPLFPAFDMEIVEPTGKLILTYCPEYLMSVLEAPSTAEVPYLRHLEEQRLWERIGLLEDLLRGIQQWPNNPILWDEEDDVVGGLVL